MGWTLYYNEETNHKIPIFDYDSKDVTKDSTIDTLYKNEISLIDKGYIPIRPPFKNGVIQRWTWNIDKAKSSLDKIVPKRTKNGWTLHYVDERENKQIAHKSIISDFPSSQGKSILNDIGIDFPNSKPVKLIKHLIEKYDDKNCVVLDFFAGSGTTAQAVMELNEEDGGNRRFILITNNDNNIAKSICYERIYRIINGVGTKNEEIKWLFNEDKKSLKNNQLKYLKIKPIHMVDGEFEDINNMNDLYQKEFDKTITIKDFFK